MFDGTSSKNVHFVSFWRSVWSELNIIFHSFLFIYFFYFIVFFFYLRLMDHRSGAFISTGFGISWRGLNWKISLILICDLIRFMGTADLILEEVVWRSRCHVRPHASSRELAVLLEHSLSRSRLLPCSSGFVWVPPFFPFSFFVVFIFLSFFLAVLTWLLFVLVFHFIFFYYSFVRFYRTKDVLGKLVIISQMPNDIIIFQIIIKTKFSMIRIIISVTRINHHHPSAPSPSL